jgi:hypothetical protein
MILEKKTEIVRKKTKIVFKEQNIYNIKIIKTF